VANILEVTSDCSHPAQLGFRLGHQTSDISQTVKLLAQKSSCWGKPCYILKADVFRAFDSMEHEQIANALDYEHCNPRLTHALLRELSASILDLQYQGYEWTNIVFQSGGWQGGAETPALWNRLLNVVISRSWLRFETESLGFKHTSSPIRMMVWADDMILFSDSLQGIRCMWTIVSEELVAMSLSWKPGSLELLRVGDDWGGRGT
jgi:hypothetical protein